VLIEVWHSEIEVDAGRMWRVLTAEPERELRLLR
jgi:hypothetical protein